MRVVPTPPKSQDETLWFLTRAIQEAVLSSLDGVLDAVKNPNYLASHTYVARIGNRMLQAVKEVKNCAVKGG